MNAVAVHEPLAPATPLTVAQRLRHDGHGRLVTSSAKREQVTAGAEEHLAGLVQQHRESWCREVLGRANTHSRPGCGGLPAELHRVRDRRAAVTEVSCDDAVVEQHLCGESVAREVLEEPGVGLAPTRDH